MRVLICDDDASIREFLRIAFEIDGWDVDAVSSGEECLDAVGSGTTPDVLVLDQVMPGLQGTDVAQLLRGSGFTRPIILCSAFLGPQHKHAMKRFGLVGVNKIDVQAVVRVARAAAQEHEPVVRRPRQQWPD